MTRRAAPLVALGLDGAPGGWAAACLYADADDRAVARRWETELRLFASVTEATAFAAADGAGAPIAIDIPIGLPATVEHRACDRAARTILGARASCVFTPPARSLLAAGDYAEVRRLVERERATNPGARGLSAQAAGLIPKIAEVDAWVRAHPDGEQRLFECHPEVSFTKLDGGRVPPPKTSAAGAMRRIDLASRVFPDAPERLADTTSPVAGRIPLADCLDAYAALWTALRHVRGLAEQLGDGARDDAGLVMRIVA